VAPPKLTRARSEGGASAPHEPLRADTGAGAGHILPAYMKRRRSIAARILAPLALLAAAGAIYLVVDGTVDKATTSDAKTTTVATVRKTPKHKYYVVKKGDVLSAIAAKNNVSIGWIQKLNSDLDPNTLRTGQRIKLKR
jgi:LysM repeat protein